MFLLLTVLSAAGLVLHYALSAYMWIIVISAVLSWVRPDPYNPIVRTLRMLTEPVLWRVRRRLPFVYVNGLDLSPIVIILAIMFVNYILIRCVAYLDLQLKLMGV